MKPGNQTTPREVVRASIPSDIGTPSSNALRARPKPRSLEDKLRPIKIIERGGVKVLAEPCDSTVTQLQMEYKSLVPEVQQARSLIRSQGSKITITQLQGAFRGSTLGRWADGEEWEIMVEEFGQSKGKVATAKGMARAIMRRKTGLRDETLRTYIKRGSKSETHNNP